MTSQAIYDVIIQPFENYQLRHNLKKLFKDEKRDL